MKTLICILICLGCIGCVEQGTPEIDYSDYVKTHMKKNKEIHTEAKNIKPKVTLENYSYKILCSQDNKYCVLINPYNVTIGSVFSSKKEAIQRGEDLMATLNFVSLKESDNYVWQECGKGE